MGQLFTQAQPNGPKWQFSTNPCFFWDTLYKYENQRADITFRLALDDDVNLYSFIRALGKGSFKKKIKVEFVHSEQGPPPSKKWKKYFLKFYI